MSFSPRERLPLCIEFILNSLFDIRFRMVTHRGSDTSHTSTGKSIKNDISRRGIMQKVTHYSRMRDLRMIRMSIIDRIIFTFTYVFRIWLCHHLLLCSLSFGNELVFLLFPLLNELIQPRIRTSRKIRRVRQCKDVIISPYRKSLYLL